MTLALIVLGIFGLVIAVLLLAKVSGGSSVVVTGPGVRKIHDVECKFRTGSTYHGDLDHSRWSDGQERVSLTLRRLPGDFTGPVAMVHQGRHVADFDAKDGRINYSWKGQVDGDNPEFRIGDEVRLEFGGHVLKGIVEAD